MNLVETADRYEWPARALFGTLLAASALGAAIAGGYVFAGFVALVTLRTQLASGLAASLVLFAAIWAADTGALLGGRVFKGPKLVPSLSPNKTWAGFLAGTAAAAVCVGLYVALIGGRPVEAALI